MTPTKFPEITVALPSPSARDMADNANAIQAAFANFRQAKLRLDIKVYGPGTPDHPKARYYFLLGMAPTITCRTPEAVERVLEAVQQMVIALNGWVGEDMVMEAGHGD